MPVKVEVVGDECPDYEVVVSVLLRHIDTLLVDECRHLVTDDGARIKVN